jgi:hypothetical protein
VKVEIPVARHGFITMDGSGVSGGHDIARPSAQKIARHVKSLQTDTAPKFLGIATGGCPEETTIPYSA